MEERKNRVLWFISFGALLGAFLTSWLAPKAIAWYFDPPVNIGVNCKQATEWSMAKLQMVQLIGLATGATFGLFLWLGVRSRSKRSAQPGLPTEPF